MTDLPPGVQALASQVRDKAAIVMMRRLLRARGHSTGKFSVTVAEQEGWPHAVTQTAVNLLLAWLVIRLVSDLVPYAALARLIAAFAWVIAALNILHLLTPTLDLLNSVADGIQGRTICALGDAAAMPVRAMIKHFRHEFEYHVEHKACMVPAYV